MSPETSEVKTNNAALTDLQPILVRPADVPRHLIHLEYGELVRRACMVADILAGYPRRSDAARVQDALAAFVTGVVEDSEGQDSEAAG